MLAQNVIYRIWKDWFVWSINNFLFFTLKLDDFLRVHGSRSLDHRNQSLYRGRFPIPFFQILLLTLLAMRTPNVCQKYSTIKHINANFHYSLWDNMNLWILRLAQTFNQQSNVKFFLTSQFIFMAFTLGCIYILCCRHLAPEVTPDRHGQLHLFHSINTHASFLHLTRTISFIAFFIKLLQIRLGFPVTMTDACWIIMITHHVNIWLS